MTNTHKKADSTKKDEIIADPSESKVCGIVMPIASMSEDYPAEHWMRVRKILEKSIIDAGFSPKVVWDNPDVSVIQSKILKNIYENEVIICDLSNLNPNVMLEAGLRLSTKKPTILVTDNEKKPPFDISSIEYIAYPKNLEYNKIYSFIKDLSERIYSVSESYKSGKYKSFVDSYKFEIASPTTIEIPAEKYLAKQIDDLKTLVIDNILTKNRTSESIDITKNHRNQNKKLEFKMNMKLDSFNDLMKEYGLSIFIRYINYTEIPIGMNKYEIDFVDSIDKDIYNIFKEVLKRKGAIFI